MNLLKNGEKMVGIEIFRNDELLQGKVAKVAEIDVEPTVEKGAGINHSDTEKILNDYLSEGYQIASITRPDLRGWTSSRYILVKLKE